MHRFSTFKSFYHSYCRQLLTNSSNTIKFDTKVYTSCSHCKDANNHLRADPRFLINKRFQSTHEALVSRSSRKKKKTKNHLKYVELLEVNDTVMKETKASVTKFNSKQLSKLTASTDVSLGQLHKLKSANVKTVVDNEIDRELLREIENAVLNKYRQNENTNLKKDEDDGAVIFMSEHFLNLQPFQDRYVKMLIKDSYDKFRRETVRDQKMKDLICAINEGVNQNINPSPHPNDTDGPDNIPSDLAQLHEDNLHSTKGAHEIFRECLSEFKQLNYDSVDFDNLKHIEELKIRGIHIPCISEVTEDSEMQYSEELTSSHKSVSKKKDSKVVSKESTVKSVKSQAKLKKVLLDRLAKQRFEEIQKNAKIHSLTQLLMAHLDICVAVGSANKGLQILQYYRNRGMRMSKHALLKDVNLYNILLHGFAEMGDYSNSLNVLNIMKTDSIAMNLQSYAAMFECIQRSEMKDKFRLLNDLKNEMLLKGMKLNDLMDQCKFTKDQEKHILNAIRQLEPSYEPQYTLPLLDYTCPLVVSLNPKENSQKVYTSPAKGLINSKQLMEKALKQIDNEIAGSISVENIKNIGKPTETVLYCRDKLKKWEEEWKEIIRKSFERNLNALRSQSSVSHQAINVYPYLCSIEVEEYVELLLSEIRKFSDGSESYSPSIKMLQKELGLKVYNRYLIRSKQKDGTMDKIKDLFSKYCDWYMNRKEGDAENYNSRRKWQQLLHENRAGASIDLDKNQWPVSICVGVGTFLYDILMNDIKVDINIFKRNTKIPKHMPALYTVYRGQGYTVHQELKPHPLLVRLVRESCPPHLQLASSLVPSLCPPLPWSKYNQGGYLLTKTPLMRLILGAVQQVQRLEEAPPSTLFPALDCLNQLGAVPWRVNKPVLDILLGVFRSGGSRSLKVTQPAHAAPVPPPPSASLSRSERAAAQRVRATLARQRQEMHSLWCDSLYKLSLANHFRDDIFWLPHNMDFRGRVYPCNPHLSHLGNDQARAVMLFARGAPLGPQGLSWLKLHCINLTGLMKKETLDERLVYIDSIMDDILDSADKPLEGRRWWAKSEKPWQTLACCMEIANASRSPNPEEYVSHFPIHQDGSCNGLQHYAALGGDSAGAHSVNLTPADRPQDVYSAVVNLVEASRAREAEQGLPLAQALQGFIKRKVIKQTVMTTVYGVTRFGARLQIAKQLKDLDAFPKALVWNASSYLTMKTFESLREMFTSTKEIQDWFTDCAKMISGPCGEKVEWVTPLGLPVVQPYFKPSKALYSCKGNIMEYACSEQHEKPCIIKQRNAFPPNFIHSLDSSHMMLTSLHCEEKDITFVSVHDCFWTHPSTVHIMNQVCREQFVALHSLPILDDLSDYLLRRYNCTLEDVERDPAGKTKLHQLLKRIPQKGDFDLQNVLNSVYFFS